MFVIFLALYLSLIEARVFKYRDPITNYIGTYEGEYVMKGLFLRYVPEGQGTFEYSMENVDVILSGTFKNGVLHGNGVEYFSNGDEYRGSFKNGRYDGEGKMVWPSYESFYEGEWKNGTHHGRGVKVREGDRYEGEWQNNLKHGFGRYQMSNGDYYEGEWFEDKQQGKGKFVSWTQNIQYDGQWEYGHRDGLGKMKYADGSEYEGAFSCNKRHGYGLLKYSKSSEYNMYIGYWSESMRHGQGKLVWKSSDWYSGQWRHDKRSGVGQYWSHTGQYTYSGDYEDDKEDGYGLLKYTNGSRYEGMFRKGEADGFGSFVCSCGNYYSGEWKMNARDGFGMAKIGCSVYEGHFRNDKYLNPSIFQRFSSVFNENVINVEMLKKFLLYVQTITIRSLFNVAKDELLNGEKKDGIKDVVSEEEQEKILIKMKQLKANFKQEFGKNFRASSQEKIGQLADEGMKQIVKNIDKALIGTDLQTQTKTIQNTVLELWKEYRLLILKGTIFAIVKYIATARKHVMEIIEPILKYIGKTAVTVMTAVCAHKGLLIGGAILAVIGVTAVVLLSLDEKEKY